MAAITVGFDGYKRRSLSKYMPRIRQRGKLNLYIAQQRQNIIYVVISLVMRLSSGLTRACRMMAVQNNIMHTVIFQFCVAVWDALSRNSCILFSCFSLCVFYCQCWLIPVSGVGDFLFVRFFLMHKFGGLVPVTQKSLEPQGIPEFQFMFFLHSPSQMSRHSTSQCRHNCNY